MEREINNTYEFYAIKYFESLLCDIAVEFLKILFNFLTLCISKNIFKMDQICIVSN